jgi:uncharacterized FlaG/YvyC family protein
MRADELIQAIAAAGFGSGVTSILVAVITSRANKGKARADAADLLTGAAERVGKMNEVLDRENTKVKIALDDLSMAIIRFLQHSITEEELLEVMRHIRDGGKE